MGPAALTRALALATLALAPLEAAPVAVSARPLEVSAAQQSSAERSMGARTLTASVAVSMKDALEEVARRFTAGQRGVTIRFNFGASGDLDRQIQAGAPVDVFVSAGKAQMDDLERRSLIVAGTRRDFARNVLVVIVPAGARLHIARAEDLAGPRVTRIAVGDPRIVPAGAYAEQSLRALGLLDRVRPKLVYAENVRQALEWVARGEVDAGYVYATDAALRRGRVAEAFRPAERTYEPIVYPAAVVRESGDPTLARSFVEFLVGAEARAVLSGFGFLPAAGPAR